MSACLSFNKNCYSVIKLELQMDTFIIFKNNWFYSYFIKGQIMTLFSRLRFRGYHFESDMSLFVNGVSIKIPTPVPLIKTHLLTFRSRKPHPKCQLVL